MQHNHCKKKRPFRYVFYMAAGLFIFMFSGCGRKQKNIFSFDKQEQIRLNKLSLPAAQGVTAKKTPHGNQISWFALELPQRPAPETPYLCAKHFLGYNVYRLVRINVIPKHPCNRKPINQTSFIDRRRPKKKQPLYYLVRAVFTYNKNITEGPTSLIVRLQD